MTNEGYFLLYFLFPYLWFVIPQALIFRKAGRPWWPALIPMFNLMVILDVAQLPLWWFVFYFIPLVNIWFVFRAFLGLGAAFGMGKGRSFVFAIFYIVDAWILALGPRQYVLGSEETKLFKDTE